MHWFYDPDLTSTSRSLPSQEAQHAAKSLRVLAGEEIAVTNGKGFLVSAEVTNASKTNLDYRILSESSFQKPEPELVLVQALAKGDRDELALQSCVEVGLAMALPWQSERSIVRWSGDKSSKGIHRWRQIAIEAMKQSHQTHLCQVPEMFSPSTKLPGKTLVLDPTGNAKLSDLDLGNDERINLIVGPEGGISSEELKKFETLGYLRVRLGDSVMRTSTAGLAALSSLKTLLGSW